MRKFNIKILEDLAIWHNHYLSYEFINKEKRGYPNYFKRDYPLMYCSRVFDKPSQKWIGGSCIWWLDDKWHRIGKPAMIWVDGSVSYYENGEEVK